VWRPARRTLELTVRPMEPLPFVGSVELRVVSGAVVVLGHELRASDPPRGVELHSPAGGLPLAIQTASPVSSGARVQLRAAGWRADAAEARERGGWGGGEGEGGAWDDADADADADAERDDDGGGGGDAGGAELRAMQTRLGVRALPTLRPSARLGAIVPAAWEAAADELCAGLRAAGGGAAPPVVLLCGPRNVGKSSFGRLLCNRALSSGQPLAFLECDVGQPEMTMPGMVALHALRAPLLGPPHTHLRAPLHCRFAGDASPAADPRAYVGCVSELLECWRRELPGTALVVNTCGWVSGLGLQLLADVAHVAQPTTLVCLHRPAAEASAERLLATLGAAAAAARRLLLPGLAGSAEAALTAGLVGAGPSAADCRALSLLAYLGALPAGARALPGSDGGYAAEAWQRPLRRLLARPPAVVPLAAVNVRFLHATVDATEHMHALNATLVALGRGGGGGGGCEVLGLGIVRSVDERAAELYVLTPIDDGALATVDTILRGSLELPLALMQPTALTAPSPYLAAGALRAAGAGAGAMRSRNNLVRGGRAPQAAAN